MRKLWGAPFPNEDLLRGGGPPPPKEAPMRRYVRVQGPRAPWSPPTPPVTPGDGRAGRGRGKQETPRGRGWREMRCRHCSRSRLTRGCSLSPPPPAEQHRGRDRTTASSPSDLPARCGGAAGVVNQAVATQRTATSQHQGHAPPRAPAARTLRRLIPGLVRSLRKPSLHAAVARPVRGVDSAAIRCPGPFAPAARVSPSTVAARKPSSGCMPASCQSLHPAWNSFRSWPHSDERSSHAAVVHPLLGLSAEVWLLFQNARGLTENSLPVVPNIPDPPLKHTGCHLTVPPERNKRTPGWLNLLRVRLRLRS
ncbi:uncharacterized protein LOC121033407 [Herpailurus yagouaroundi]|uniref:uncharacterized protein LOC121033407 n=1 Tax=Herpailurus yagouaroundi TaxID=1608482 RepID=UPI001AD77498|nr:uncharacterized protein LOC121033407 [Puma yagouaroundi]XP_040335525.1 uncharacterized protein LOC121033407 [Puma yagouaroundi]XP_040335526.1 uncharacterized protein LOC121033407 [Puma yagouaroundi]XP_040335527.1 uncharacterized protein LOC121033407 [Puma yagouaroundi]XP_040335528.1 uncharacterized protein LOC121033407 [Puma yagouaroundi]